MTIQEVIDILKTGFDCILPMLEPVYKVAIEEALEKQIPKKPVIDIMKRENGGETHWKMCPSCYKEHGFSYDILVDKGTPHCCRCGQKLDWN